MTVFTRPTVYSFTFQFNQPASGTLCSAVLNREITREEARVTTIVQVLIVFNYTIHSQYRINIAGQPASQKTQSQSVTSHLSSRHHHPPQRRASPIASQAPLSFRIIAFILCTLPIRIFISQCVGN